MYIIQVENIEKSFGQNLLYSGFSYTFKSPETYAILGPNGCGKSTLLQILMGYSSPNSGNISWSSEGQPQESENLYKDISFTAPYLDLPEELTATECINLHFSVRNCITHNSPENILLYAGLHKTNSKYIRFFSSGMKQRLKLLLAFLTDSPVLFLDEPCSNLDREGINLYKKLIHDYTKNRLVIIASNVETEYEFCSHQLKIISSHS